MKKVLRILAVLVLLAAGVTWLATGASLGWTKTSVMVRTPDPVTGIDSISYQKKFIAGVDFLGGAFAGAALFAGTSLFFRKPNSNQPTNK